ncbi:MAG: nicotinamide mononucleotide transporter [Clostridia bacterium]|nr:nicotinamide mononucleotide transporter [Clostridia bacterium]
MEKINWWMRENRVSIGMTLVAAVAIAWTGIIFEQSVFRIIPLFVSLIVGLLQTKANRYACLLGGFNSLIYAAVYVSFGLYASAASALLISCPFQLVTFVRWSKHAYRHSTEFRKLTRRGWLVMVLLFAVSFVGMYMLLSVADSKHRLWDIAGTLVGFFVSVLTLLGYREYTWLILPSAFLSFGLNVSLMLEDMAQITYVIYSLHSMLCQFFQFFSVRRLYQEQQTQKGEEV